MPVPWLVPALASAAAGVILLLIIRPDAWAPLVFGVGLPALFVYRRFRHRRRHLLRRFVTKVKKLPEVSMVSVSGSQVTVVADKALAKTYVRVNALIDSVNTQMFFGDPFTVTVRDELSTEEARSLLSGAGVLYVRDDA
jgi:hypothetical protein